MSLPASSFEAKFMLYPLQIATQQISPYICSATPAPQRSMYGHNELTDSESDESVNFEVPPDQSQTVPPPQTSVSHRFLHCNIPQMSQTL